MKVEYYLLTPRRDVELSRNWRNSFIVKKQDTDKFYIVWRRYLKEIWKSTHPAEFVLPMATYYVVKKLSRNELFLELL